MLMYTENTALRDHQNLRLSWFLETIGPIDSIFGLLRNSTQLEYARAIIKR